MTPKLTPEMLADRLAHWRDRTRTDKTTARQYPWIACFADDVVEVGTVPRGFTLEWRTGGRAVVGFAESGPVPGKLDEPCGRQRAVDTARRLKGGSRSNMVHYTFALLIGGGNRVFCQERKGDGWTVPDTGLITWMKDHLWPDPHCSTCDRYRLHQSRRELCPALDPTEPGGFGSDDCHYVPEPDFDFSFDPGELASCPFCGGEAFPDVDGRLKHYAIGCRRCDAQGPAQHTLTAAAEAWNKRKVVDEGDER